MDDDDLVYIPAKFWRTLPPGRFGEICESNLLNAEECALIWRMTDRQDRPPLSLYIEVSA